jgi:hypothetical protein
LSGKSLRREENVERRGRKSCCESNPVLGDLEKPFEPETLKVFEGKN